MFFFLKNKSEKQKKITDRIFSGEEGESAVDVVVSTFENDVEWRVRRGAAAAIARLFGKNTEEELKMKVVKELCSGHSLKTQKYFL